MSLRIQLILLLILIALPNSVLAWWQYEMEVCNKGSITFHVARAHVLYDSPLTFDGVEGWWKIKPNRCEDLAVGELPGDYWLHFLYEAKDGTSGSMSVRDTQWRGGESSKTKFLTNFRAKEFEVRSTDYDLADVPSSQDGEWIMAAYQARFYLSEHANQNGITLRPNDRDSFCPYDGDKCYVIRDYEAKAHRGETKNRGSSSNTPNETSTRTPTPTAAELRRQRIEREARTTQLTKCNKAAGCDVNENPYMYRPFGETNWYDANSKVLPQSRWPDLPPRVGDRNEAPWVAQINKLLVDGACERYSHPDQPLRFDADNGTLELLTSLKTKGFLFGPGASHYTVETLNFEKVFFDKVTNNNKCWIVHLRCADGRCVDVNGATSRVSEERRSPSQALYAFDKQETTLMLRFNSEDAAKTASEIFRVVAPLPTARKIAQFIAAGSFGAGLVVAALSIPLILCGALVPRRVYPFSRPNRIKGFFLTLCYCFSALMSFVLLLVYWGPASDEIWPLFVGAFIGLVVMALPAIATKRLRKGSPS